MDRIDDWLNDHRDAVDAQHRRCFKAELRSSPCSGTALVVSDPTDGSKRTYPAMERLMRGVSIELAEAASHSHRRRINPMDEKSAAIALFKDHQAAEDAVNPTVVMMGGRSFILPSRVEASSG